MGNDFRSDEFGNVRLSDVPELLSGKFFRVARARVDYAYFSVRAISNFWEVPLLAFGVRKEAVFRFRDRTELRLERPKSKAPPRALLLLKAGGYKVDYNEDFTKVQFDYAGRRIALSGPSKVPFHFAYNLFLRRSEYPTVDVKGKVVVDVGANIGDTAVYFMANGAEKVIAFEPFPDLLKIARLNVRQNGLESRVELVEAGVGGVTGAVRVSGADSTHSGGSQLTGSESPQAPESRPGGATPESPAGVARPESQAGSIRLISLSDVAEKYALSDAVLKVDCEGAEYGILLDADKSVLRKFSTIMLEYHYGYENLLKKLQSAGFSVKICGRPKYDCNPEWKNKFLRVGVLLAERK